MPYDSPGLRLLRLGKVIATATQDSKDPSSSELNYLTLETETVKAVTGSVTGDAYQMRIGVASLSSVVSSSMRCALCSSRLFVCALVSCVVWLRQPAAALTPGSRVGSEPASHTTTGTNFEQPPECTEDRSYCKVLPQDGI